MWTESEARVAYSFRDAAKWESVVRSTLSPKIWFYLCHPLWTHGLCDTKDSYQVNETTRYGLPLWHPHRPTGSLSLASMPDWTVFDRNMPGVALLALSPYSALIWPFSGWYSQRCSEGGPRQIFERRYTQDSNCTLLPRDGDAHLVILTLIHMQLTYLHGPLQCIV